MFISAKLSTLFTSTFGGKPPASERVKIANLLPKIFKPSPE